MAVFEVQVIIPITIQADSEEEAIELAKKKAIFERKDLRLSALRHGEVKQTSMF
jgi:hypothetical protein